MAGQVSDERKGRTETEQLYHLGHQSGYAQALEDVGKQIDSSTGPTGGWLDSPKALFAAVRSLAKGKEGSNGLDL